MDILTTKRLSIAICKALDVDYEKHPVGSVSVEMESENTAKVNITFHLSGETLRRVAELISDNNHAETKS